MKDITFGWKGKEYKVEAQNVLPLIARVEEVLTLSDIYNSLQKETLPLGKLSMAFGVALRYAGANVKDEELYLGMFNPSDKTAAFVAMNTLLSIMVPPEHLQEKSESKGKKKSEGNPKRRFVKEAFQACVTWGMSPADFWKLDVDSVWWFIESKMGIKMYAGLTEDDAEELYQMMKDKGI